MQRTFDEFWAYAQWPTALTNALIADEIPAHVVQTLATAGAVPEIARRFVDAFTYPPDLQNWLFDPALASSFVESATGRLRAFEAASAELAGV
jgi:hypothetical protein